MTKWQKAIAAIIATFIFSYVCLAFVRLETNPFLWSEGDRIVFCYLFIAGSWFTAGLPIVLFKDKKSS